MQYEKSYNYNLDKNTKKFKESILFKSLIFICVTFTILQAGWIEETKNAYNSTKEKLLDNTVIEETKNVFNATKEKLLDNTVTEEEKKEIKRKRFNEIWEDVFPELEEASELQSKMIKAPDSAWFGTDKNDIKKDIESILNDIYTTLIGDELLEYKEKIKSHEEEINDLKKDIQTYIEEKITAPSKSTISTTKNDYNEKISDAKEKIKFYEKKIELVKENLSQSFKDVGVDITDESLDIVLSRVDGDDFIQMYLVADVLKQITTQLLQLMNENNEELSVAKNYYGMHLVSMQLVVYIQENYKNKLENNYLVQLDTLRDENKVYKKEAQNSKSKETSQARKEQYENNIKSLDFNLEVIALYKNHLKDALNNINKAIKESRKQVLLSKNTFKTVSSSSQLSSLINQSMLEYDKVMQIQMPEIQSFKNMEIKEKYKQLSKMMKSNR